MPAPRASARPRRFRATTRTRLRPAWRRSPRTRDLARARPVRRRPATTPRNKVLTFADRKVLTFEEGTHGPFAGPAPRQLLFGHAQVGDLLRDLVEGGDDFARCREVEIFA